jgi:hypothetical protein
MNVSAPCVRPEQRARVACLFSGSLPAARRRAATVTGRADTGTFEASERAKQLLVDPDTGEGVYDALARPWRGFFQE